MRHCVWIDPDPQGFRVMCIPHGDLGAFTAHLAAFIAGVQHDHDNGGGCL